MKIPDKAKRVFKGKIFEVYQWQQEMFDGSFETFEMLKRVSSNEIIATMGDKILLSHQSQPNKHDFYSLFGGRAEENEDPLLAAKRELLEEAALESDDWELINTYEPLHKMDWQIYSYVARNCKKVGSQKLDSGEKIDIIECSFEEFIKIVKSEKYWGNELLLEIYKMESEGKLEDFRKKLFS